jgi:hypothetical protein
MPRRVVQAITAVGTRRGRVRSPRASTAPATRGANETRRCGLARWASRLRAIRNAWSASAVSGLMRLRWRTAGIAVDLVAVSELRGQRVSCKDSRAE